ncbi:hypothetical protein JZ751_026430 [Albula glossodonta]|uniref:Uncharacterized protein n=1 Tax=Albula glossodonta TaxID=121402 RepID=A0A8T2PLL6_9TELE|nr:hypothetical protein JZ751_026430 [Albula glossodonta]
MYMSDNIIGLRVDEPRRALSPLASHMIPGITDRTQAEELAAQFDQDLGASFPVVPPLLLQREVNSSMWSDQSTRGEVVDLALWLEPNIS